MDGFFPESPSTDLPQQRRRMALQQLGLPYAADAAITIGVSLMILDMLGVGAQAPASAGRPGE